MMDRKRGRAKSLKVGAEVMTPLGVGCVRFVYPVGPHHKITYSVSLQRCRVNRIFNESEIQLLTEVAGTEPVRN